MTRISDRPDDLADPVPPTDSGVASLPMYDWPELRAAMDCLWRAIAERELGLRVLPELVTA